LIGGRQEQMRKLRRRQLTQRQHICIVMHHIA
jgi:hypothetical protein